MANTGYEEMLKQTTAIDAIQRAANRLMQPQTMEYESIIGSLQRSIDSIMSPIDRQRMIEQTNITASLQRAIGVISPSLEQQRTRALASITDSYHQQQFMTQTNAAAALQRTIEGISPSLAHLRTIGLLDVTDNLQKTIDSLIRSNIYERDIEAIFASTNLHNQLGNITRTNSFRSALASLAIAENLHATIFSRQFSSDETIESAQELVEQLDQLTDASDASEFSNIFRKIPTAVKWTMLFIIMQLLTPIFNNVVANLITPHVEDFIKDSNKSKRELVKGIATTQLEKVDLSRFRFVTVDVLLLREQPNKSSPIIDRLVFGQVLTVLSKERNWIEVTYINEDGETIQGWCFTRHTTKFKK